MENKEDRFWEIAESTILKCTKHDEFLSEMKKHFKYIRTASQRFMVGDAEIISELSNFWHTNKEYVMKLELKNIKYFASGSQETPCYTATVYVDGKKAIYVSNNGHGGCDKHDVADSFTWKDIENIKSFLIKQSGDSFEPLDIWCHQKMYDFVDQKKLKRDMNTKYICVDHDKNQLYAYPKKVANSTVFQKHMEKKHPKDVCLNFLSFDSAWHIYEGVTA